MTTTPAQVSGLKEENLNLINLPTREDKLSALRSMTDGFDQPVRAFAEQFYNYPLAETLLAQICTEPTEVIRGVCATDLSRGPYLFTYRHPVSTLSSVPPPYLFVDLSNVHERAFGQIIAAYKEQVKRPDYTDLERIATLSYRVLSIVLTAADWIESILDVGKIVFLATDPDK